MHPGGFTVFMFHPRSYTRGHRPLVKDKSQIREHLDVKHNEEIVEYFSRKQFYVAKRSSDLKIQLQTCLKVLELLTGRGSISTRGLSLVVDEFDRHLQFIDEMFDSDPDFGAKFAFAMDRALQQFFSTVQGARSLDDVSSWDRGLLEKKAQGLLDDLLDARALDIVLPSCLRTAGKSDPSDETPGNSLKRKAANADLDDRESAKARPETNPMPEPKWSLPSGKQYGQVFKPRSQSLRGWPSFQRSDGNLAPMCVRYQATKKCRSNCPLAHPDPSTMDPTLRTKIDEKFSAIYASL
jgi:hypothetical protein